jgi:hypothetical protein
MGRVNSNGLMVEFMKVSSRMIRGMVMAYLNGLIREGMKECGVMESRMEKEGIMKSMEI